MEQQQQQGQQQRPANGGVPRFTSQINVVWFVLFAVVSWNLTLIVPVALVAQAVLVLVICQTYVLRMTVLFVLGDFRRCDDDALSIDTRLTSLDLWLTVINVYASGLSFAPRYLWLLSLRRLLRVPGGRAGLWPACTRLQKARLALFSVALFAVVFLSCAYWVTDPHADDARTLLVMEGLAILASNFFELAILAWTIVYDVMDLGTPDPDDIPHAIMTFAEAIVVAGLGIFLSSLERTTFARADGSSTSIDLPIPIQVILIKRMWLVKSSYARLSKCLTVLDGISDVVVDGTCMICLDSLKTTVAAKRLPCGHAFHPACLRRWLMTSETCPLCRQNHTHRMGMGMGAGDEMQGGETVEELIRRNAPRRRATNAQLPPRSPSPRHRAAQTTDGGEADDATFARNGRDDDDDDEDDVRVELQVFADDGGPRVVRATVIDSRLFDSVFGSPVRTGQFALGFPATNAGGPVGVGDARAAQRGSGGNQQFPRTGLLQRLHQKRRARRAETKAVRRSRASVESTTTTDAGTQVDEQSLLTEGDVAARPSLLKRNRAEEVRRDDAQVAYTVDE